MATGYLWEQAKRNALARLTPTQRAALARAEAEKTLARLRREYDESEHPRDETGKWTDGGGGGGGAASKPASSKEGGDEAVKLDPVVTNVGGDDWNKKTAEKLEREFQTARPKIEHLEQRAIGNVEDMSGGDDDDEDMVYMPEEWEALSSDDQQEAHDAFIEAVKDDYYNSEVDNWRSEYAEDEAMAKVAGELTDSNGNDSDDIVWAQEALDEIRDAREEEGKAPIPFDNKQLINAMSIDYEAQGGSWPKKDAELSFDDDALSKPEGFDPDQQTLPGMDPIAPHEMLSEDMREEIDKALMKAFEKRSGDVAGDLEPPDYLMESAKGFAGESWDQKDDSEKFEFVQNNTNILEKYEETSSGAINEMKLDRLPSKYDPLNNTSGDDYKRTQALARYLSRERSKEILEERGLDVPSDQDLRRIDNELWSAWKESSTSKEGKLIQLAAAEELGGRLNDHTRAAIEPEEAKVRADRIFSSIGGYDGVKALIRAKWETTQHLLDKAGENELQLYRGLTLDKALVEKIFTKHAAAGRRVGSFTHLPTMDVKRNGAASTTTALTVANGWGGSGGGKVVLRAVVPRTAAISIPAYGINIKSEQEVVIAGTAWKGWDVWQGQAPGLGGTPLQKHD